MLTCHDDITGDKSASDDRQDGIHHGKASRTGRSRDARTILDTRKGACVASSVVKFRYKASGDVKGVSPFTFSRNGRY